MLLLVLFLCALPFAPGLSGPFQLDDTINLETVYVGSGSPGAIYDAAFSNTSGPLGRPLANLTFVANQLAGGTDPFGYKLVNLVLHAAVGWLVFLLAARLLPLLLPGRDPHWYAWVALATAVFWTIHPLQVSTTLYVVQRMTQLATLFMLVAVLLSLRPLPQAGRLPGALDGGRHAALVGLVALLGVLGKETAVLVPFLLLAAALALPKPSWTSVTSTPGKRTFWALAVALPVALFVLASVALRDRIQAGYALRDFSMAERLVTEPWILAGYLRSFLLPDLRTMGLFLDGQPLLSTSDPRALLGLAAMVLVVGVAWLARRRFPVLAFAVFWFIAAHLLESTFLPLEPAFEHRNYLALFGPALWLATLVAGLAHLVRPRLAVFACVALALTFGGMTFLRAMTWADHERFITSELRHHPESLRVQVEAAALESMQGDNAAALGRIEALRATHPAAFFPLGMDLDFGCAVPGHEVDWTGVLEAVRRNPHDLNITSLHKTVAIKLLQGRCHQDIEPAFRAHLERMSGLYRDAGMPLQHQFFLMVQADFQDDPEQARQLLRQAVAAAPGHDAALYRLAYMELNAGNAEGAAEAIGMLRERTPWWRPSSHRVTELERFLSQLRAERAGR